MQTVLESLNAALHKALAQDQRVFLLGEDILDPYGGAFKVSHGLSDAFPGRVITTPISEAGILGIGTGMALRGLLPVVEIMFGDFLALAADQLVNHTAKFSWIYSGRGRVPLVVRTPMGGRRGYGPTHSQTLEKLFLGVPGLKLLAPSTLGAPGDLLLDSILSDEDPIIFVENKLLYLLKLFSPDDSNELEIGEIHSHRASSYASTYTVRVRGAPPPEITLTAYGYMADLALQAARRLAYENEIFIELVVPEQLSPFEIEPILASASRTGKLFTVEEGSLSLGWGAEILARVAETLGGRLRSAQRLASSDWPIPASRPLEEATLPGVDQIIEKCRKIAHER
jgi:pyruvate/2-oxoglutarate/acetoin dehydrogenase E1 component